MKHILIIGPYGSGKTHLLNAIAGGIKTYTINGPNELAKEVREGCTEFEPDQIPSIVFVDELHFRESGVSGTSLNDLDWLTRVRFTTIKDKKRKRIRPLIIGAMVATREQLKGFAYIHNQFAIIDLNNRVKP